MSIAASDEFKSLVKKSHRMVTKVAILNNGVEQPLPDGVSFNLLSGSMTEDKNNAIRRTAQFEIVDPTDQLLPQDLTSLIAPNRNEIVPYRGVMTSQGPEYKPLGVFGFREVSMTDSGKGLTISIQGYDRSDRIARQTLLGAYTIAAGVAVETAIHDLINAQQSGIEYLFAATGQVTPLVILDRGADPWAAAQALAKAAGFELFFDYLGRLVLQPEPDPSSDSVSWTFDEGDAAIITNITRKLAFPAYNHVVAIAEGTNITAPYSGEAQDDNPDSPTYVGYGDFPLFSVSPNYTDPVSCQQAADAQLRKILGATENVSLSCIVNSAIAASDILSLTHSRLKIDQTAYVVDRVVTPFTAAESQQLTLRQRVIS